MPNIKNILKFENPNIFNVIRSLLFLNCKRNHMLEINIINGNSLIIRLGINKEVRIKGKKSELFIFLKNSISSNKFNIIPKL